MPGCRISLRVQGSVLERGVFEAKALCLKTVPRGRETGLRVRLGRKGCSHFSGVGEPTTLAYSRWVGSGDCAAADKSVSVRQKVFLNRKFSLPFLLFQTLKGSRIPGYETALQPSVGAR